MKLRGSGNELILSGLMYGNAAGPWSPGSWNVTDGKSAKASYVE